MLTRLLPAVVLLASAAHAQTLIDPLLQVHHVADNLGVPPIGLTTAFVFVADDTVLAVDRADGRIRRLNLVHNQVVTPGPTVLDLDIIAPDLLDDQTEYGVQAMALHPDFAENRFVYIRYDRSIRPKGGGDTPQSEVVLGPNFSASLPTPNVIERYTWDPGANDGDGALLFDSLIHTVTFDTRYHHGGPIVFGPEPDGGKLYTIYGDLRRQTFIPGHAGPLLSMNLLGGLVDDLAIVLRLNDDGSIPDDNPFEPDDPNVPEGAAAWYTYGVRNSFGLDFDPSSGALWTTENGDDRYDEINRLFPGHNGGWIQIQGPTDHPMQTGSIDNLIVLPGSAYSDPEFSWFRPLGVTAIHFLHGSALGERFDAAAIVGVFNVPYLWAFRLNAARDAFVFQHPGLQDRVDDRAPILGDPRGTEAEELLFGEGFGAFFSGIIAIGRGPDALPCILTATGDLYRLAPCTADFDTDGAVNSNDYFAFLAAFFAGDPRAELNGDGDINSNDYFFFLTAFFGGC